MDLAAPEDALFNRQYLVVERVPDAYAGWRQTPLDGRWTCLTNNLSAASASCPRGAIVGLGELIDPDNPEHSNEQVLQSLLRSATDDEASSSHARLEEQMARLGGRWVVATSLDGSARLYPDAFGVRSTFHTTPEVDLRVAASQPGSIAALLGTPRMPYAATMKPSGAVGWPGTLSPYEEVVRLLPNFYLDLDDWSVRRFWPQMAGRSSTTVSDAADALAADLNRLMSAIGNRWPLQIGLTAGYDSRLTVAAAVAAGLENVRLFTQIRSRTPGYEAQVAVAVAESLGLPHRVVPFDPLVDHEATQHIMERNVAGMGSVDEAAARLSSSVGHGEMLLVSHVTMAFKLLNEVDNDLDAVRRFFEKGRLRRYRHRDIALRAFEAWLDTTPAASPIDWVDLFRWEMSIGTWVPNKYLVYDAVAQVLSPLNSRRLQLLGLAVDPAARLAPYRLLRETIARLEPAVLEFPFNRPLPADRSEV